MNPNYKNFSLYPPQTDNMCHGCQIKNSCFSEIINDFSTEDKALFIEQNLELKKNQILIKQGEIQKTLFIVQQGALKATRLLKSGREKIARFYLPGDTIGLAALQNHQFLYDIEACSPTLVCQISLATFNLLCERYRHFLQYILDLMSQRLREHLEEDPFLPVEIRLAQFMVRLILKLKTHYPSKELTIPFSRRDIASYLGMAIETLSRILTKWQHCHWLHLENQTLHYYNIEALLQIIEIDKTTLSKISEMNIKGDKYDSQ